MKAPLRVKSVPVDVYAKKSLLNDIRSIARIAQHPTQPSKQPLSMSPHQTIEGDPVSSRKPSHIGAVECVKGAVCRKPYPGIRSGV